MESYRIPTSPRRRPSSVPHLHAVRCCYHYLEDLTLRMFGLTDVERQLGHLLLRGLMYQQIAQLLFRSESTIKSDARRIFLKVRVKDRRAFERHVRALVESI